MHCVEAARRVFQRHGLGRRLAATAEAEDRVERLSRELAEVEHRIPWHERLNVLHESVDEARASELRKARDAAGAEAAKARRVRDEALGQIKGASLPLDVVIRAERAISGIVRAPGVGRLEGRGEGFAQTLEALAEDVLDAWAPGVALDGVIARLRDQDLTGAPTRRAETQVQLGWAPVDEEALFAIAAHAALSDERFTDGMWRAHQARERYDRMDAELREMEAHIGLVARVVPGSFTTGEKVRDAHKELRSAQREEVFAAVERAQISLVDAVCAHPMVRVAVDALAVSAALRSHRAREDFTLTPSGELHRLPAAHGRAVVLAALRELREALDDALPGLSELVSPRRGAPARRPDEDAGPYRYGGAAERPGTPLVKGQTEESRQLHRSLEASDLRAGLGAAVGHARLLAVLERGHRRVGTRVGWVDRAIFWSDTDEQANLSELETRILHHRDLVHRWTLAALGTVSAEAARHPLFGLGHSLVEAQNSLATVGTFGGNVAASTVCPVLNREPVVAMMGRAVAILGHSYGAATDRDRLSQALCARLEQAGRQPIEAPEEDGPLGPRGVVELLASRLQGKGFPDALRGAVAEHRAAEKASDEAGYLHATVSWLDRVNVFTDSETEQARDRAKSEARRRKAAASAHRTRARELYEHAVLGHAPTDLANQGSRALAQVHAIRAYLTRHTRTSGGKYKTRTTYYRCNISGVPEAKEALQRWCGSVVRALGPIPSTSELLEEWIVEELR